VKSGYTVRDGEVVREASTPQDQFTEAYLRKVMIHTTVEAQHLSEFPPQLYAEHKEKPDDAD